MSKKEGIFIDLTEKKAMTHGLDNALEASNGK